MICHEESALAVARNLNVCLATSVRTELDSALEDVGDYIALGESVAGHASHALRTPAPDARGSALDDYLTFGNRIREQLAPLRRFAERVVTAAGGQ